MKSVIISAILMLTLLTPFSPMPVQAQGYPTIQCTGGALLPGYPTVNCIGGKAGPYVDFHTRDYGACVGGTVTAQMQATYTAANAAAASGLNAQVVFDCNVTIAGTLSPANNVMTDGRYVNVTVAAGYNGNIFVSPAANGSNINFQNLYFTYLSQSTGGSVFDFPSCYECSVRNVVISGSATGPFDIFDLSSAGHQVVNNYYANIRTEGENTAEFFGAAFRMNGSVGNTMLCSDCGMYGSGSSGTSTALIANDTAIVGGAQWSELDFTDMDFEQAGTGYSVTLTRSGSTWTNIILTNVTVDGSQGGSYNVNAATGTQSAATFITNPFFVTNGSSNPSVNLVAGAANAVTNFKILGGYIVSGQDGVHSGANVTGVDVTATTFNIGRYGVYVDGSQISISSGYNHGNPGTAGVYVDALATAVDILGNNLNGPTNSVIVVSGASNVVISGNSMVGSPPSISGTSSGVVLSDNYGYNPSLQGVTCVNAVATQGGAVSCTSAGGNFAAFAGVYATTVSAAATSGAAPALSNGDLGASRGGSSGALTLGGSTLSCTTDFGVTTAATLTIPCATTVNGKRATFASCTDSSVGLTTCSATVAYTSATSYACGMSYVPSTTTTGAATGENIINTSATSVTGTILGLAVATGTATLLFNCLGS